MSSCAYSDRCVEYDRVSRTPGRTAQDSPLCASDLENASKDIARLPSDYDRLRAELVPADRGDPGVIAADDDDNIPLALDIEALRRAIYWALTVWEPPVRERAGLPDCPSGPVRDRWAVHHAAAVIVPRTAILAALPGVWGYADGLDAGPVERDGLDAIRQLRHLHRHARYVAGITRRTLRLPGWCSRCGAPALSRRDGGDTVRCETCEQTWTYDDYRRYVGLMLVEANI